LTQNHLKRTIQSNVEGHDSLEDAKASLHLVYLKAKEVQEDLRLKSYFYFYSFSSLKKFNFNFFF